MHNTNVLLLNAIPASVLCILFMMTCVTVSQFALYLFNRWYGKQEQPQSNEVAGFIFGALSLIYSLILAFVIVAVWDDYEVLSQTIEKESDKLNSILAHSLTLPDSLRHPINTALSSYCNQVIREEWKMDLDEWQRHPSAIPNLRMMFLSLNPADRSQESIFSVIDDDLSQISDLHRERLGHTKSHVPDLVWLILRMGSVMIVLFSFFLNTTPDKLKRIFIFFLVSLIAMCLFLVFTLDNPFSGSARVSEKPYENILRLIKEQ